jgi:RNA polymerase sigma-70 factor (ECF subfamily)
MERPLFNVLYRMLWNQHECQDLMQDAFLRVWQRRAKIEAGRLNSLVWVSALNLARNRLRWHRRWRNAEFDSEWPDMGPTPEQSMERLADQRQLHKALRSLPAAMREVLLLTEFAELSQADVAALLRIPSGTVASRHHHAITKLRNLLAENGRE